MRSRIASIRRDVVGGCERGRPSWSLSFFDGLCAPIAFDIHLKDRSVMNEPVDGGLALCSGSPLDFPRPAFKGISAIRCGS